jgi:hypothetical protein
MSGFVAAVAAVVVVIWVMALLQQMLVSCSC